ncbi:MAG TPA: protein kinase [Kofleriaceae bacterium]|nr:protein kinase [Kofleriaceae bacterium]
MPAEGGIRFGQYALLRRIARGGMAEVFLAQQRGLEGFDRRVAVKRILPHLADSPDFVKMFLGEARLAAQLSHPNIVHIYDFGKVESDYFIAMEYVEGIHCGELFKHGDRERLSPTLVARIGADAAAALNYAHELVGPAGKKLGLVHRDVSPANIMVSYDGIVKLCDFGIAKAMATADQLTNPGQVKGKYAYMSPEQTVAAPLDGRSDVFSLAIVLWELLAGRTIVPRGDAVEAMRAIRDGKLAPIERVAPATPPPLAKAIGWALETKRDRRATAAELAHALETFIKGSPELATSMQLAAWVRPRFPRDASGPHPALTSPGGKHAGTGFVGTQMSPGTMAAPGTSASVGTKLGTVTPPQDMLGASVASDPVHTAETVSLGSDEIKLSSDEVANATVLDNLTRELAARPTTPLPIANRQPTPPPSTAYGSGTAVSLADQEPTALAGESIIVNDTVGDRETVMRSGAWREPIASGPPVVPTRIEPALGSGPRDRKTPTRSEPSLGSGPRERATPVPGADTTFGTRRAPRRYLVPIVALTGIAVLSFVIALAMRPGGKSTPARDAGVPIVHVTSADAVVVEVDAAPAIVAPDDAREPTIRPDAGPGDANTFLEVITKPDHATVRVGDQSRQSPTQFALTAGTYTVIAELPGYEPEKRTIELVAGDHLVREIVFSKKLAAAKPQTGRLTVRTNPYSDVYDGTRKIGQTPFELELPAGGYTLLFKNPSHPTTSRAVRITAGKTTKLNFDLPRK